MVVCTEVLDRSGQSVTARPMAGVLERKVPTGWLSLCGVVAILAEDGVHFDFDHVGDEARRQRVEHACEKHGGAKATIAS